MQKVASQDLQVLPKEEGRRRGVEIGVGEACIDVLERERGGMEHVRGIEAVITQVVHHELIGGKVGEEGGGGRGGGGRGGGESCFFVEDLMDGCEEVGLAASALHCLSAW